jgi:competence protein ComEC
MVALADEVAAGTVPKGIIARAMSAAFAAQEGRTVLWAPVALTFGIWTYFALAREPQWWLVGLAAMVALPLFTVARGRGPLALAALVLFGLVLAKVKADWIAAPVLHATTAERLVTGRVEDISPAARGRRVIILAVDAIEGVLAGNLPRRLRLSVATKQGAPEIGWRIAVKAVLAPLPSPVMPGGFDYGRNLWWDGIGGTGRATAAIETLSTEVPAGLMFRASVEALRQLIGSRITRVLDGTSGAIGEAIITGQRSAIPRAVNLSFQVSGLAHVLSISGLHMALAAGGVFWFVRAVLALFPVLALRYPIKKWAAAVAMLVGLFYMILAGTGVATQRSYIMIAIVFFAIMVDRPAISVRNLALAAVIILVLEPEAAIQASFQMSFLAVMGLTAYYEAWADYRRHRDPEVVLGRPQWVRVLRKLAAGFAAAIITTIVAGSLSSIPAAFHFGRLAPYSVVANGLALPVISLVIMPMALLSVLAMPFGLEAWPLWAMGQGIDAMIAISNWVAGFPGAYVVVAQPPAIAVIVTALGAALLCLLRGPARFGGAAVAVVGIALSVLRPMPDIFIERTASVVAVRSPDGMLVPAPGRKGRFAVAKWLLANGEEESPKDAIARDGWTCTQDQCRATVRGKVVLYLRSEGGSAPDCGGADIVIAAFPLRRACATTPFRIDRFDVWRHGAHALTIADGEIHVTTAHGEAGERPWVVVPEARTDKYRPRTQPAAGTGS